MYVDDFVPVSNDLELMRKEKAAISERFKVVDNGVIDYFLGMVIKRDRRNKIMTINQPN